MKPINLNELTEEQQNQLMIDLENKKKAAKQKRRDDLLTYKEFSADFVNDNVNILVSSRESMELLIKHLFNEYQDILALKQEIYGVKDQDSHTSTVEDGSASITIGYNVTIGFDGTESAGVEKIKNYISTLSGEDDKLVKLNKMVSTFLKINRKTGQLNPSKIIELSNLRDEFNNEGFNEGLEIIFNAQIRQKNSMYVSGWKYVEVKDAPPKKIEFRFTI